METFRQKSQLNLQEDNVNNQVGHGGPQLATTTGLPWTVSHLQCSSHSTEIIHPGVNQFELLLNSDCSTERTTNLLLQTYLNVHCCAVSSCLPRRKVLGVCLCVHGEGIDNNQCHQACLINTPVTSTPFFHFAIPSGPILKSLSPHFCVYLPSPATAK